MDFRLRENDVISGFEAAKRVTHRAQPPPMLTRQQGLPRSNPGSIPEAAVKGDH